MRKNVDYYASGLHITDTQYFSPPHCIFIPTYSYDFWLDGFKSTRCSGIYIFWMKCSGFAVIGCRSHRCSAYARTWCTSFFKMLLKAKPHAALATCKHEVPSNLATSTDVIWTFIAVGQHSIFSENRERNSPFTNSAKVRSLDHVVRRADKQRPVDGQPCPTLSGPARCSLRLVWSGREYIAMMVPSK